MKRLLPIAVAFFSVGVASAFEATAATIPKSAVKVAEVLIESMHAASGVSDLYATVRDWLPWSRPEQVAPYLKTPKSYCALPRTGSPENELYAEFDKAAATSMKLLQYALPCPELPAFWQGADPSRWSMFIASKHSEPKHFSRAQFIVQATKEMPSIKRSKIDTSIRLLTAKPNEDVAGIVETSSDAVYVLTLSMVDGDKFAEISGITLLKHRVVGLNFFAPFRGQQTIDRLLSDAKESVAASIAEAEHAGAK